MPAPAIVPVLVIDDAAQVPRLAHALIAGGIGTVEVTLRTDAAWDALRAFVALGSDLRVGAGTLVNTDDVERARDIGAAFIVSPGLDPALAAACDATDLTYYPGIATATEAQAAGRLGIPTVKVFPVAFLGGAPFLSALHGPFPQLGFFPSGGIDDTNIGSYVVAPGTVAIGTGWIAPRRSIGDGNFDEITARAQRLQTLADAEHP